MSKPFTKSEVREWMKDVRRILRSMEQSLKQDDWDDVYQGFVAIGAELFVDQYEQYRWGDGG